MINGLTLRDAFISGANNISNNRRRVDELNVFPVPDGDTGTNMFMTINNAKKELENLSDDCDAAQVAKVASSALLRGARGNSGVILSLLFRGFSKGFAGKREVDGKDIAEALKLGVDNAYKAVMKPTEGTILTVARVAAEKAVASDLTDPLAMWNLICNTAGETLEQTPEMLPVLKKAGVVDAGGKGLLVIFEGMKRVFEGQPMVKDGEEAPASGEPADEMAHNAAGENEEEIHFTYCTEFIVRRANNNDSLKLRAYLETIGDCVVVVDDDGIIKTHVHTDDPGRALHRAIEYGQLITVKVENMREQHAKAAESAKQKAKSPAYAAVDENIPYGFVSVAAGEGIAQLFRDLGVDAIVSGGQTMNPSTDDILNAVQSVPAKTVFVLPNNKNIIMAAEQAIALADREVRVLPTRTIPQGLSAMLAFDTDVDADENCIQMAKAFERVGTGQVTFAARDSEFDGYKIKEGELLALENGKISFVEQDLSKAVVRLTKNLVNRDSSFITLMYGEGIEEAQAQAISEAVQARVGNEIEVTLINGGQPVYYFIISVE